MNSCPLCYCRDSQFFSYGEGRQYFHCDNCDLIFVPEKFHLDAQQEKAIYDQHQNSPEDKAYRRFLSQMMEPVLGHLQPGATGLDFGCGPGPTLNLMFEERGYNTAIFDKFYAPDRPVLAASYDFITATEVIEHLNKPGEELDQLWRLVRPSGVLGVMTSWHSGVDSFPGWHYKRDPTHISFFSVKSLRYLAGKWQAEVFFGKNVAVFKKLEDNE